MCKTVDRVDKAVVEEWSLNAVKAICTIVAAGDFT